MTKFVLDKFLIFRPCESLFQKTRYAIDITVKCTLVQALRLCTGRTAHRGSRGRAVLFHDHDSRKGWGVRVTPRPGRSLPPGKSRYPLYRRLVGPQGRSGQVWKVSSTPVFDPRTFQPLTSRYTDYANRPLTLEYYILVNIWLSYNNEVICQKHSWLLFLTQGTVLLFMEVPTWNTREWVSSQKHSYKKTHSYIILKRVIHNKFYKTLSWTI
jgi:hypothetical protein